MLLDVGDARQFPTTGHRAGYAGLRTRNPPRSGSTIRGAFPARSGNKHFKRALFQSAFEASGTTSKAYYDHRRAQGKNHNAARICLSRHRCDALLAMLKSRGPYRVAAPAPHQRPPPDDGHRDTPRSLPS